MTVLQYIVNKSFITLAPGGKFRSQWEPIPGSASRILVELWLLFPHQSPQLGANHIFLLSLILHENKLECLSPESLFTGNTKGGSIIVPLTSCLIGLD